MELFETSDRMREILECARELMKTVVFPLEAAIEDPVEGAEAVETARDQIRSAGMWAPNVPEVWGGMGLGFRDHAVLCEVLGQSPLGHLVFGCQAPDAGNIEILEKFGSAEQKERWLGPLTSGAIRSCFSMTEPEHAGSNPTWMSTSAVKDGDDYVINGHKWFTTAADGAAFAIVMAVTNPDAGEYGRASQIIVPTDTPGFNHVRKIKVMGDEGAGWASHSEIRYENCRVPQSNLLGGEGAGFAIAQERLGPGRIHHCMRWIGEAERALDMMCTRAATRELSPGKPLGTRQTVQNWIAESRAEIDAARLSVMHTAWKIDKEGLYAARDQISCIKFYVAGILNRVLDRALQTHGALGMTDDTPLAWMWRHERAARIYDGPDEVHKSVVARRILEKYGLSRR